MTTHTTPATALANSEQAAEPDRRASRFDQRGIALQTIIIMVVLLAIAGSVAAVLLSTGGETASQLEDTDTTGAIDTESECTQFRMGSEVGAWAAAGTCTWQHDDVSAASCRLVGGVFTPTTNAAQNRDGAVGTTDDLCVLTI